MFKLTIIAILAIVSMAFAQSGKIKLADKGQNNKPSKHSTRPNAKSERNADSKNHKMAIGFDQGHNGGGKQTKNKGGHGQHQNQQDKKVKNTSIRIEGNRPAILVQKGHGKAKKHDNSIRINPSKKGDKMSYRQGAKGQSQKIKIGKGHKVKYGKNHPNFGYLYINSPVRYYGYKNYGQYRSEQARKKHKKYHPVYEYQAVEGFNFIVVRNNYLYSETQNKIVLVRRDLARKKNAGLITVIEYDNSMQRVYVLEKRRASLELNIVL